MAVPAACFQLAASTAKRFLNQVMHLRGFGRDDLKCHFADTFGLAALPA